METQVEYARGVYRDSVALMRLSADLERLDGIDAASLLMGTPANIAMLVESDLLDRTPELPVSGADIIIVVRGEAGAVVNAMQTARDALQSGGATSGGDAGGAAETIPAMSLLDAVAHSLNTDATESAGLALISTSGDFAGGEALKALRAGLHVMLFSDNVPEEQEIVLKKEAEKRGLLVMGPDCGTALIGGVPLAFANVVRRDGIGIVGASGTGTQQVSCLADQLGAGVSHAIGTGGHDLSKSVGGLTMLAGLHALAQDPDTKVIVLISKPPAEQVAEHVLHAARSCPKPVVVNFLGNVMAASGNLYGAATLEEAAHKAVALLRGQRADFVSAGPDDATLNDKADALCRKHPLASSRCFLRGLYTGGTFCYEAQILLRDHLSPLYSNTPVTGTQPLGSAWQSQDHTILDLGDDAFTRGRPHPMIDPRPRNERLEQEFRDEKVGIILLDVVLGYGAHANPADELAATIRTLRDSADSGPIVIASVCGTESDPQNLVMQRALLEQEGVCVCESNAQAAVLAMLCLRHAAIRRSLEGELS